MIGRFASTGRAACILVAITTAFVAMPSFGQWRRPAVVSERMKASDLLLLQRGSEDVGLKGFENPKPPASRWPGSEDVGILNGSEKPLKLSPASRDSPLQQPPPAEAIRRDPDNAIEAAPINLAAMRHMQEVVVGARESGAGFRVERLKPPTEGSAPAFLLYTGTGPPSSFRDIAGLAEKISALSEGGRKRNVTFVNYGTPREIDADKLTLAWRLSRRGREMVTFDTPEPSRSINGAGMARKTLSIEGVSLVRRGNSFVASQSIGKAFISAAAATRELASHALAMIREALANILENFNRRLLTDDSSVDHAAFDALSPEVQRNLIDDAVALAQKRYDAWRRQSSEARANDGEITIEIKIQDEKRSLRFAGLRLSPLTWSRTIGQGNAAH